MELRLWPYRMNDEAAALAAQAAMIADDFPFLLYWQIAMPWSDFVAHQFDCRRGINLAEGQVCSVQLAADVEGQFVGRVSIRFELNEYLAQRGGHIG
jgi:predicted acetyltransferase